MALIGSFNATEVAPQQDVGPIPAGEYLAHIIDSDLKPTKAGIGHYAELVYEVLQGEFKGRKVWLRLNLDNPNTKAVAQRQLSAICHAVNVMNVTDTQQLHYKPHVIRVEYVKADVIKTANDKAFAKLVKDGVKSQKDSNEVKAWKKPSDLGAVPTQAEALTTIAALSLQQPESATIDCTRLSSGNGGAMSNHSYACRVMSVAVHREGDYATTVRITSEGDGEYVEVLQEASLTPGKVAITLEEWPALRDAIEKMLSECQP